MSTLRVLIVDDEALARARLCQLVAQCDDQAQVVGELAQASLVPQWLSQNPCDVLLLDIHMPELDGLALAEQLRGEPASTTPAIVFVTAHTEHAVHAFDLDALDYLTKPVRLERLRAALAKAAARARPQAPSSLLVSNAGRKIRVPVHEILYLKAELKYLTLRTATQTLIIDGALVDFEQRLGADFLRVHRNALVARSAMHRLERQSSSVHNRHDGIETWGVQVAPVGEWLAVSRRLVAAVKKAIAEGGV